MKVYLEAFDGKLKSEFMDMPEDIGLDIFLVLPMDSAHYSDFSGKELIPNRPTLKRCKFSFVNKYACANGETAAIYKLTDVG